MRAFSCFIACLITCAQGCASAQSLPAYLPPSESALRKASDASDQWLASDQGLRVIDHIVSWQNPNGGWWKKYDTSISRPPKLPPPNEKDGPPGDNEPVWRRTSTFDNGATYTEMRLIARACRLTGKETYQKAFERGLNFIFKSQYPNGGWPQRFPLEDNYGRRITFNDDAMTGVMNLLEDIAAGKPDFAFVDSPTRQRCHEAFERGIECVLNCQVKVNGKLTAWSQQYDEETLAPAGARRYELPSLTAAESASITIMLMRVDHPSERIQQAVLSACDWYESTAITGKRVQKVHGPEYANGHDTVVVDDPAAGPIWARFYDLETMKPFFCGRDGIKRDSLAEIEWERRNNYKWFGNWGTHVLSEKKTWLQRTHADFPALRVDPSGSGAFKTVQAAVDSIPDGNTDPRVIQIAAGTYKEHITVAKGKPHITFKGSGADPTKTVLTFDLNANKIDPANQQKIGTSASPSTLVQADDFVAENLTFENTAGDIGQAVAFRLTGDRAIFRNCRFLGWQDTLYVDGGRAYFKDCYIEGRVDFIFGGSTAVFENCTIHSKNGGYVTAARTPPEKPFGFVFIHCKLTGEGAKAYLGRPWRPFGAVAFLNCELGDHIFPKGWDNWRNPENEKTARFSEFQNAGSGSQPQARVPWAKQLTADEASKYTVPNILGSTDHWDPATTKGDERK
jgi:pectinesterase